MLKVEYVNVKRKLTEKSFDVITSHYPIISLAFLCFLCLETTFRNVCTLYRDYVLF